MKTNSVLLIQNDSVINYGATVLVVDLATLSPLGKVLFKEWQATELPALARALGEVCGVPLCEIIPSTKVEKVKASAVTQTPKPSTRRRRSVGSNAFARWTSADDTALQDLYTKGVSASEIGNVLGRSRQSVTNRIWLMNKNG
jgi:hypothetical protein